VKQHVKQEEQNTKSSKKSKALGQTKGAKQVEKEEQNIMLNKKNKITISGKRIAEY